MQLARGEAGGAAASIHRALLEVAYPLERPALLSAAVDIFRVTGDLPAARSAADELATIAAASSSEVLGAMAAQAIGAVLLGEGDPAAGLVELRAAATAWQSLKMPYEAALAAVLRGRACLALGDRTSAALEFDNAEDTFIKLGAITDLDRLTALTSGLVEGTAPPMAAEGTPALSDRELQVLAQLATGKTNREIAARLVISQHTVGRHLEHIFTKLGVTSRAAATAYAYEHHLL